MTLPISPPRASISRTICPLATPPMAGLQLIWATVSAFIVKRHVFSPRRAAASAASTPACPAPTTTTSKRYVNSTLNLDLRKLGNLGHDSRLTAISLVTTLLRYEEFVAGMIDA